MKVVIQVLADRALVGVQDDNTDPFVEPVQAPALVDVLAAVPGIVSRAKELWTSRPKGPAYQAPAPLPSPPTVSRTTTGVAPSRSTEPRDGQMARMF